MTESRLIIWTDPMGFRTKPSAYSKVAWNIFQGIKRKHKVAHTPMLKANNLAILTNKGLIVYPSGNTEFGEDIIQQNYLHFNADAVLTLKDLYVFDELMNFPLEWISYTPVDSSPVSPGIVRRLRLAFKVVSMSKFGKEELRKNGIDSTLIPHGFDPKIYHPIEDKVRCRRRFHLKPDDFVIGLVGANRVGKLIERAIRAVHYTIQQNPDIKNIKMFLWTDINYRIPLVPVMLETGMNEHVYWPGKTMYNQGVPEPLMAEMYNSFDLLLCVSNEGFWLPGLESAACGTPRVVVDYAAAPEHCDSDLRVKVGDWTYNNPVGVKQPLIDFDDAEKKIMKVYSADKEKLEEKALAYAKCYTWKKVCRQWLKFLSDAEIELLPLVTKKGITKWDQEIS